MATVERERLVPPEMTPEQLEMLSAAERMLMEALDRSRAATITVESDDGDVAAHCRARAGAARVGQDLGHDGARTDHHVGARAAGAVDCRSGQTF